jgi:hypothetical protein
VARVPVYNSPQVDPNTLPQTQFQGATATPVQDVAGQQARQMGQAMQQFGGQAAHIAVDMQQQANQLRVTDATNKAKEAALAAAYDKDVGFTNLKGIHALERPDGKPLAEEYAENLKKQMDAIAAGLGNDAQRLAFSQNADDILMSLRGQATQHEAQEYKTYALSVAEGVQSTAMRDIGLNWNNPGAISSAVERIKAETYRQAQLLGKSAEWQEAQARKLTSGAHRLALVTALENNDAGYADAYLKKFASQMDADDILTVRGHITKEVDLQVAGSVAGGVLEKNAPRINTSEAERAFHIAVGTESNYQQFKDPGYGKRADGTPKGRGWLGELKRPDGGVSTELSIGVTIDGKETEIPSLVPGLSKNQIDAVLNGEMPDSVVDKAVAHAKKRISEGKSPFADAEPLTSPKGAVGIAQVMPGTAPEAAKLAGLEWDEYKYKNDPAYNKALGLAYFQKQLQDFGGNLAQTYAAYNAGPQAVRDFRDGTNVSGKNPKKITTPDGIPPFAETINYVNKNMREFAAGKGKAAAPTLAELRADLREDPRLANNPSRLKAAETVLESEYKKMQAARKEADDKATDDVLRELYANGGRLDAVPATMRGALPGDQLASVMNFADQVAKNGGVMHSPEAWAAVLSLPDEQLAGMTALDFYKQFRPVLDDAHLEKGYALLANAHGGASDKHLEIISVAGRVKDAAIINGLLPEKGTPDKAQLQKFSQFERAVDDRVRRFEQTDLAGKRKANSQELQLIIDTLVLDTAKVPEWFTDPDIPVAVMSPDQLATAYVLVGTDEVKLTSIPTSQRAVIASKLQARGMPITEQRIAELWVAAGRPQ